MPEKETKTTHNTAALTLAEAVSILMETVMPLRDRECVPIAEAGGRILAEDITAEFDQPPFPRSPLDGYAVRSEDTTGASEKTPVTLKVIAEEYAGAYYAGRVGAGEAVRIMTGAPVPEGADSVIGQEDTDYGKEQVLIYSEMKPRQNYCEKGEDYSAGTELLHKGEYIGAAEAGIIASSGRDRVHVYRRPRAAIISTGDEVVMPGQSLEKGKIYDSNLFTVNAQLKAWGVDVTDITHVNDDAEKCSMYIDSFIEAADIIITTGGVSVGKKDIMHDVYRRLGAAGLFRKVRIKPGMAMLCGTYKDKIILSLSGNPYSAYADLHLLVRPVIAALNGGAYPVLNTASAVMNEDYLKSSPVRRYVRAVFRDGIAYTEDHTGGNGIVSSGRGTNALIELEAGSGPVRSGDRVKVILL